MKMNEQNKGIETKTKTRNHILLLTKVLSEAIMAKLKLRSKQNKTNGHPEKFPCLHTSQKLLHQSQIKNYNYFEQMTRQGSIQGTPLKSVLTFTF